MSDSEGFDDVLAAEPRRFRKYPEYRDSGVEWLGATPAHWREHKMAYLAEATSGGTPSKENPEFWNGEIPWVSPKDMKVAEIRDSIDHVTMQAVRGSGLKLIQPPAVLIVVRGMILAHTFPVAKTALPVTINQDMKALHFSAAADPGYFVRLVEGIQPFALSLVEEAGHGTKCLRSDLWRAIKLLLPPLEEQRTISAFLDRETSKIDALIAKKERLVELLHEKRKAFIARAVTKGLEPNVPMKASGLEWLGKIPAHWRPVKAKRLFRFEKRQHHPDETVLSVYREYGVIQKASRDDNANRTPEDLDSYQLVEAGDLVINKMKAWQGSLGISSFRGITSPDYLVFVPIHQQESEFLHHFLRCSALADVYRSISNGIRPSQWRLEAERFEELSLFLPPRREQQQICAAIDPMQGRADALVAKAQEANDRLRELRTALISSAVTGKIDVREATP